ncbi:unnamed protein product [Euphydryas editha]|uniref:Uncharacterized protein n=1 Tax=Euphydryas editha TaxID=104508 RepID=A0AAU9TD89_EUPED|nr:unnamed protein product [Euphydryas editha]
MSTNDKVTCPGVCEKTDAVTVQCNVSDSKDISENKDKKSIRKVSFPEDEKLVTQYFAPANPWRDGNEEMMPPPYKL